MYDIVNIVKYLIEIPLFAGFVYFSLQAWGRYDDFFAVLKQESPEARGWVRLFFTAPHKGHDAVYKSPTSASEKCKMLEKAWRQSQRNSFLLFFAFWVMGAIFSL